MIDLIDALDDPMVAP